MARRQRPSPVKRPAGRGGGPPGPGAFPSKRELIVIARPEVGLRMTREGVTSATGKDVSPLSKVLASRGIILRPLFGATEEHVMAKAASVAVATGAEVPDLSVYYHVEAPDEHLDKLAEELRRLAVVEGAYVKAPGEPPQYRLNEMLPSADEPPAITPDFTPRQRYLDAAPVGVDARYAWTQSGGRGAGVRIVDCEWNWNFSHEDLLQNQGGVVGGTAAGDDSHGTAVIGEFSGDLNTFGITGICPDANVSAIAFSMPTAQAIRMAADRLGPGDIILLEIHRAGPRATGVGQQGYIAIEWWPDDFDAIRYAVSKGVVVVEAGGNGEQNLDDPVYNTPQAGFPASWKNPFNPANPSSGAVLVGAGNPPVGTHGRNSQPSWGEPYTDRARCFFSNYGARVDVQGWGWEVTSTSYGDLQGGSLVNKNQYYTDQFSGTSSASPIIVGTLGCIQGVLRANGRIPLSPARAIEVFRATGSPQQDGAGWTDPGGTVHPARPRTQRIGNRPDLRQLIPLVLQTGMWCGVQFTGTIPVGQTYRWFTYNWPAQWHVVWTVVPTTPVPGAPQITWKVQVERAADPYITYWISITNLTQSSVSIEARYCVLGW
jgi:hypothetical protein